MAQMFLSRTLRSPAQGFGAEPVDSFQERVEPYFGWATREYVIEAGVENLPVQMLRLSAPYPTSRSGFFKVISLVQAKPGVNHEELQSYWLSHRAIQVAQAMHEANGFRYVVGLSLEPETAPYAGMEELYFHDEAAWQRFQDVLEADDMQRWVVDEGPQMFFSDTEFVAIPV